MPKRPQPHRTADTGIAEVMRICARAGWACDKMPTDYGEDLIVQTAHQDVVDPFRIFLQVKATGKLSFPKKFNGHARKTFKRDHIIRWIRSPDLVVIVLWDVVSNEGYYVIPTQHVAEADLIRSTAKTRVPLWFCAEGKLDAKGIKALEWTARLEHFDRLLTQALRLEELSEHQTHRSFHRKSVTALCTDFLATLGILEKYEAKGFRLAREYIGGHLKRGVWEVGSFQKAVLALTKGKLTPPIDMTAAATVSVVDWVRSLGDRIWLSPTLLYWSARTALVFLSIELAPLPEKTFTWGAIGPQLGLSGRGKRKRPKKKEC